MTTNEVILDFLKLVIGTGIGGGIGAWFGTLKTRDAAIKAAKVAGDETRKAMREQVEAQARIATAKEQKNLACQVLVHGQDTFSKIIAYFTTPPLDENYRVEIVSFLLPLEIESLLFQLDCLDKKDKFDVGEIFILLRMAHNDLKNEMQIDDDGNCKFSLFYKLVEEQNNSLDPTFCEIKPFSYRVNSLREIVGKIEQLI